MQCIKMPLHAILVLQHSAEHGCQMTCEAYYAVHIKIIARQQIKPVLV